MTGLLLVLALSGPASAKDFNTADAVLEVDFPRAWERAEPSSPEVVLELRRKEALLRITRLGPTMEEAALGAKAAKDLRSLKAKKAAFIEETVQRAELDDERGFYYLDFEMKDAPWRTGYANAPPNAYAILSRGLEEKELDDLTDALEDPVKEKKRLKRLRPLTECRQEVLACRTAGASLSKCMTGAAVCEGKPKDGCCAAGCAADFKRYRKAGKSAEEAFFKVFDVDRTCMPPEE